MSDLKPDSDRIREFLKLLERENWIKRSERRLWPRFVFHYTDIRNAVEILKTGHLVSRNQLERKGRLPISSGSPDILAKTDSFIKDCVRLYFRPRTPTQYWAEGVCSKKTLESRSKFQDAHSPVPIFFLFDSAEILSRVDCWFSDGGLGSSDSRRFYTSEKLERLPWKKIYHNTGYDFNSMAGRDKRDIINRKNAEVIVHKKLDLTFLKYIYCRSEAERETLLYLLPYHFRDRFQSKIVATARTNLYFRRHTFIERAGLTSSSAIFSFSPDTKTPGPYHLKLSLKSKPSGINEVVESQNFILSKPFRIPWDFSERVPLYDISLKLDEHLVYANSYIEEKEIPF